MSCFSHAEIPLSGNISKQPKPTIIKPDIRSVLPTTHAPGNAFPFFGEGHNFTPKMRDLASALYGLPYGSSSFYHGLPAPGLDASALYNSLEPPEPTSFEIGVPVAERLSHLALTDGGRRKNATRETASVLKSWLDNHKKNPYPTKNEKIILALETKMSLTQVSTWFANARRRLKKENKMTWPPRNGYGEERDSGEENQDHGFPVSPRDNEEELTPCKSESSTTMASEVRDPIVSTPVDVPYQQQYQQQMIWRHLALLPPHLRTLEALKQVQEQMHLRSRWAATAPSEAENRNTDQSRSFLPPGKMISNIDPKSIQERRSSVGSPSTSSYDRSPSPLHRSSQSTWIPPTLADRTASFRKVSSNSETTADQAKRPQEEASNTLWQSGRKSTDDGSKSKPTIWSPANMVNKQDAEDKHQAVNSTAQSMFPFRTSTSHSAESSSQASLSSRPETSNSSSNGSGPILSEKLSPSVENVNFPLHATMAQAYLREYQRQLATHQSLQNQQGLPSVMLPMAMDKNQQSLLQNQLLEHFHRNQSFQQKFMLPQNELTRSNESPIRRSLSSEAETSSNDAPMNLSKSGKSRDETHAIYIKNKDSEPAMERWSAIVTAASV